MEPIIQRYNRASIFSTLRRPSAGALTNDNDISNNNNSLFIIKTQQPSETHHHNMSLSTNLPKDTYSYTSIVFDASTIQNKLDWIIALRAEINRCTRQHFLQMGYVLNKYEHLRLTNNALLRSPNLRQLAYHSDAYNRYFNDQQTITASSVISFNVTHSNHDYSTNRIDVLASPQFSCRNETGNWFFIVHTLFINPICNICILLLRYLICCCPWWYRGV